MKPRIKKWTFAFALAVCALDSALGFYNPNFGRWTTRDPIEEENTQNLYVFVKNNPVGNVDPCGMYTLIEYGKKSD